MEPKEAELQNHQDRRAYSDAVRIKYGVLYDRVELILFEVDPIGIGTVANELYDEYGPEVDRILPSLCTCRSREDVMRLIEAVFMRMFGEHDAQSMTGRETIAQRVWDAWLEYAFHAQVLRINFAQRLIEAGDGDRCPCYTHYVYLYRDARGTAQFVGCGMSAERALSELLDEHKPSFQKLLDSDSLALEVAGPFDSEAAGRTVAAAVVSALKPAFNRMQTMTELGFFPSAVPHLFADRRFAPPLLKNDFVSSEHFPPVPVLFVPMQSLSPAPVAQAPAAVPSDDHIRQILHSIWTLTYPVPEWVTEPDVTPKLLIAVHSTPCVQVVVAAMHIDETRWNAEECACGKVHIHTRGPLNLDAFELRGRRIDSSAQIAFNHFVPRPLLLGVDGTLHKC